MQFFFKCHKSINNNEESFFSSLNWASCLCFRGLRTRHSSVVASFNLHSRLPCSEFWWQKDSGVQQCVLDGRKESVLGHCLPCDRFSLYCHGSSHAHCLCKIQVSRWWFCIVFFWIYERLWIVVFSFFF